MEPFGNLSVSDSYGPDQDGYDHSAVAGFGTIAGPRAYKSRKNRPCDFCRTRKAACKIAAAPPCALCQSYGRDCTFLERPQKRKRPAPDLQEESQEGARQRLQDTDIQSTSPQSLVSAHSGSPLGLPQLYEHVPARNGREPASDLANQDRSRLFQNGNQQVPPLESLSRRPRGQGAFGLVDTRTSSLAENLTKSAVWVGDSGEADPHLCRRYHYNHDEECILSSITYRRILNPGGLRGDEHEEPPVIFMLPDDSLGNKGEPRNEESSIEEGRREVESMVPKEVGDRLFRLFFRFIYPYFPVLSRTQTLSTNDLAAVNQSMPLSLVAAVYATALPFFLYDDVLATTIIHCPPSASRLYRISWLAITQEIHKPRLATFQACLLLLQRAPNNRYVMDTPFQWSLVGWTVSLAYVLGLNKSCSGWNSLPRWERRLRGRLWWAIYVMDKWAFLGAGMPSHMKIDDTDVLPPNLSVDGLSDMEYGDKDSHNLLSVPPHFYHLVCLTTIVSDIVDAYYSVQATSRTANNFSLSLELAKPLRTRLRDWKQSFTASMSSSSTSPNSINSPQMNNNTDKGHIMTSANITNETLNGNASLGFAYIVAAMTLYRALLRAVENHNAAGDEDDGVDNALFSAGRTAVLAGAKECGKEAVDFVEDLMTGRRGDDIAGVWDAFWHSWSRANFALASSFLMRVLVNVHSNVAKVDPALVGEDFSEVKGLIFRWRRILRLGSGNAGNGMMGLALLRLEGNLSQEEGLLNT